MSGIISEAEAAYWENRSRRVNEEMRATEEATVGRLEHEASKVLQPGNVLLASIAISMKRIADSLDSIDESLESIDESLSLIAVPPVKSPPP